MSQTRSENTKNVLWRVVISVSSLLLIAIAGYFIFQLFTSNPLEGVWSYEDSNLVMTIEEEHNVTLELPDEFEDSEVTVKMLYTVDVDEKTFILGISEEEVEKAAAKTEGKVSGEQIHNVVSSLEGSYSYSIEQNQLILTEQEYGEQLIFDKQ